jgi:integrase
MDMETGKPKPRQRGYVYQKGRRKGEPWKSRERAYGRFRVDIPGQHGQKEVRVALGYCRDELDAMLALHKEMEAGGVLDLEKIRERISAPTTFREQAAWWISEMKAGRIVHAKRRDAIDPNTIAGYQNGVSYLTDLIGDLPVASIDNPEAKDVITTMKSERLKNGNRRFSDKTILDYFQVLRRVVASELDEKFNPVHARKWNLAAIGVPRVNPNKQRRPTLTARELTMLLSKAEGTYQMLYFFCAITGMRVSEAVAVEVDKHMEADCSIIYVRQQREKSVNRIKEHLKTESGCRDVDIYPEAAAILRQFINNRRKGFLFRTANGSMLDPGNVARDSLRPILKEMGRAQVGTRFNIFRRFREAVLQRSEARQILIDYWMGHASASMGDRYGRQLVEDVEYRQQQINKVGLGFEPPLSLFGLRGLQIVENSEAA